MQHPDNLIWIDLEMTGLDPDNDVIIEIATIVTDAELNVLAEGPSLAVKQPDALLDGMDEWNTTHHTASGLVDRVLSASHDTRAAELATLSRIAALPPATRSRRAPWRGACRPASAPQHAHTVRCLAHDAVRPPVPQSPAAAPLAAT